MKSEPAKLAPWHMTSVVRPTWLQRVKLLFGAKVFIRFNSPDGRCSAACTHTFAVARKLQVAAPAEAPVSQR